MPEVSLILALHREGNYLARTLSSLTEAALYARGVGIATELVAVLDRSDALTEETLRRFDLSAFEQCKILSVDNGSLGPTRNDGCKAADGTYIATADGDDLISFNYIERMLWHAEKLGPNAILIPQFIFAFGETYHITEYFDLDQVTPLVLLSDNPFVSRVFFHRSLCSRLTYHDVNPTSGYAYEDWHFNCNAIALGYTFHAAPETILFYRQRSGSLLAQGTLTSVRQIPPSPMFQADCYRQICAPSVERFAKEGDFRSAVVCKGKNILRDPVCLELLIAAHSIEPAIEPSRLEAASSFNYLTANIAVGMAYHRLCETIGERQFDEVFLLPFLTTGGADRYVLDVITELAAHDRGRRILVLFGEPFDRYVWLERLPEACLYIDLCANCPELGADERDLLCLKLLQSTAGAARLHLRSSEFAQRFFARFAPVLASNRPVFYRFSDGRNVYGELTLVEPSAFQFISEHIETLDRIVCDNATIITADQRRLRFMPEKWELLYARIDMPDRLDERALAVSRSSRSILWVSRLDPEKRPELLVRIARLLAVRLPDVTIEVFGRPTLDEFDVTLLSSLANVEYHGFFERFEDLNVSNHHSFIYTSRFDGMPIVLLEMTASGLPVIAPHVGSIGELIRDQDTGLLLACTGNDATDAELYVSAIETLFADPTFRDQVVRRAFALVRDRHSPLSHAEKCADIFDLTAAIPGNAAAQ
jgi:glycosyltransferase involved in cell wall biosynthesis